MAQMSSFICLILLFGNSIKPISALLGFPYVANCYMKNDTIKVERFTEYNLFLRWSKEGEHKRLRPLQKYRFSFKWKDRTLNMELDLTKFLSSYNSADMVRFYKYSVDPGSYKVIVTGTLKNPKDDLPPMRKTSCYFDYIAVPPVAVIMGGSSRTVASNNDIELNGMESSDPNLERSSGANVGFKWSCTQKIEIPTFCEGEVVSGDSKLKIPAAYMMEEQVFVVTLTVISKFATTGNTTQTIYVKGNAAEIAVLCEKNCPPVSDISNFFNPTLFKAKCNGNCIGIQPKHYEWTIRRTSDEKFQFDYEKNTEFGRNGLKFYIRDNVLQPGEYVVTVKLAETSPQLGEAAFTLTFATPPMVSQCGVEPKSGESMVTFFRIKCEQGNRQSNHYEFVAVEKQDPSKEIVMMDDYYPNAFETEFVLPSSKVNNYFIRISFQSGPPIKLKINLEVLDKKLSTAEDFDNLYKLSSNESASIHKLLTSSDSKERDKGISQFQALVDRLVAENSNDTKMNTFIQNLKYDASLDLLNTEVTSLAEIDRMGKSITQLMNKNAPKRTDPHLAKLSTTLCKKMMEKHLDFIKNEKFPYKLGFESGKVSKTLNKCLESNTNPNFQVIAPLEFNVSTEAPMENEIVITENYDNYVDYKDDFYENIQNLKEATYNIIKSASMSAKIAAMTTAPGEKFVEVAGDQSSTVVAKDAGKVLYESNISSQGVILIPSKDFADDSHNYDILMSVWSKDLFWWNRGHVRVSTNIASLEFWHSTCKDRITTFHEPAYLVFTIKNQSNVTVEYTHDTFIVPENYENLSGEELSRAIKVRRIDLAMGQNLRIEFVEVPEEEILEVVMTELKFPTAEDFMFNTTTISNSTNVIEFENKNEFGIWCFLGVLPNKTVVAQSSVKTFEYNFSSVVTSCIRWVESKNSWESYCKSVAVQNSTLIKCGCTNFSVIAAHNSSIKTLLREVIPDDIEMEFQACPIIFITLAITIGVYCVLLIFSAIESQTEAYYLADNNRSHLFAYLISVQTGSYSNSGTTSNVTIRIIGEKAASEPHVLNYPDPKLRLLQKFSTDLFLLTAKYHLGNITKIELWFDCSGPSPDWYCKNITIYDMQKYSFWYFKVKKRFAVIKGDAYVELTPTKTHWFSKINFIWKYHTWWLIQDEENFSYANRLTVVLSIVVTTFMVILVLTEVPLLQLQDGFDQEYKVDVATISLSAIGSFPTFLVHLALVWGFRSSKMEIFEQGPLSEIAIVWWIILVLLISISTSFLIVFGFWSPFNKSLMWLTTCGIALFLNIFIYEPIFTFIQSNLCRIETRYHIRKKLKEIWQATENQRIILYENFDAKLLRPYFTHLYKPMKNTTIQIKQKIVKHRRDIASELEDLVMFGIYVVILYLVVLSDKDRFLVRGKISVEEMVQGVHTRSADFHDISSIHDFYEYVSTTLVPAIQPLRWYGNFVTSEPAMTIDMNNKYMGVIRFRQLRIRPNICTVVEPMSFIEANCSREISLYNTETGIFGYGKKTHLEYLKFDRLRGIWVHVPALKAGSFGAIGEFSMYSGGGYISYLGRSLYNSYANFREMFRKVWLDGDSRGVFIEFLTYNANYNLFNSVELLFEQSVSGYTSTRIRVVTARMLFVGNELQTITFVSLFLFLLWVGVLFLKQAFGTIKKIRYFYKDTWFLVDFLIIAMSVACIVFFILRKQMIKSYLDKLEHAKKNEFVSYFYIFYIDDFMKVFAAILICISTVRLWKFLRFGLMFRILERTLILTTAPILSVFMGFLVFVITYTMVIMLLFGDEDEDVHEFLNTLRQLVMMYLQAKAVNIRRFTINKMSYFYVTVYAIVLQCSAVLLETVIVMSYTESQLEFSSETQEYNLKNYLQERINYLPRLLWYKYARLRSGQENTTKILSKSDKFLYLNSYSMKTVRMKIMEHVTRNFIKRNRALEYVKVDFKSMGAFCKEFFHQHEMHEVEVFFKGRMKGKRISLIDEQRITEARRAVGLLLEELMEEEEDKYQFCKECDRMIAGTQEMLRRCDLMLKLNVIRLDVLIKTK